MAPTKRGRPKKKTRSQPNTRSITAPTSDAPAETNPQQITTQQTATESSDIMDMMKTFTDAMLNAIRQNSQHSADGKSSDETPEPAAKKKKGEIPYNIYRIQIPCF